MTPTLIGFIAAAIGLLLLLRGTVPAMFAYLNILSLMGGSAVVILTALGGSSIPPVELALGFAALRLLLPGSGHVAAFGEAVRANMLLVLFALFGTLMAFVGPRLFAYQMQVVPMRPGSLESLFSTDPLMPTSQNITTAVYLLGTLMAALVAHVAMRDRRTPRSFVNTAVFIGWAHVVTGVFGALVRGKPLSAVIDFFRNANYAQTEQFYGSYARISGIMPEPSSYASFAFAWFVFLTECWWRDVLPRRTGPIALALLLILAASTSSTAYGALLAYAAIFGLRMMMMPGGSGLGKILMLGGIIIAVLVAVATLLAYQPQFITALQTMIADATVNKQASDSGLQRLFWAKLGLQAFVHSGGLGIGPGSFRSSSIFTAIIGSTGIIGSILFLLYLIQIIRPPRRAADPQVVDPDAALGAACSWAAIVMLVPAAGIGPSPDPGVTFAVFAGAAIALRGRHTRLQPALAPS